MPRLDFFKVQCKGDAPARIDLRGPIDMKWDAENYTITDTETEILNLLKGIPEDRETHVHVSSEGGSVKMALGIHNAFKPRAKNLTFHNAGVMLSSATLLPPKGAKVITPKATLYGIHRPTVSGVGGNADELRSAARSMDAFEDVIAGIYADRTGKTPEQCKGMMSRTTLMGGSEAVDEGFADETGDEEPDEDDIVRNAIAANVLMTFRDLPQEFRARIEARATGGNPPPPKPKTEDQKRMKKLLTALVEAKLIASADLDEDQATAQVRTNLGQITTERESLKVEIQGHLAALKLRVENRVKSAIEAKKVTAAREASLIAMGVSNESNLDFLDDIASPGAATNPSRVGRGAVAAPAINNNSAGTDEERLQEVRNEMSTCKDPSKLAGLARQARKLRGQESLIQPLQEMAAA